uniref:Uncharacterized protein n=1 Tax=Oryza meridionalis TaxID=40149 RepID=A0A0E0CVI4_9ORYZ
MNVHTGGEVARARAMTPVMIPVLRASIMYGDEKFRLVAEACVRYTRRLPMMTDANGAAADTQKNLGLLLL